MVAALVVFGLVARLAIWLLPHGVVRQIVVVIDDVVLIGLLVYFGWEMFVYLWNGRSPMRRNVAIGAAFTAAGACLPLRMAKPLGAITQALLRLAVVPW